MAELLLAPSLGLPRPLARISPSPLWELLGLWAVSGGALTLAQGVDAGGLHLIGLAGSVLWAGRVRSYLAG